MLLLLWLWLKGRNLPVATADVLRGLGGGDARAATAL